METTASIPRETNQPQQVYFCAEGFLTSCSFDFLTDTDSVRYFVMAIFLWSYVTPILLIVCLYSKLFGKVREHSQMLAAQVSGADLAGSWLSPYLSKMSSRPACVLLSTFRFCGLMMPLCPFRGCCRWGGHQFRPQRIRTKSIVALKRENFRLDTPVDQADQGRLGSFVLPAIRRGSFLFIPLYAHPDEKAYLLPLLPLPTPTTLAMPKKQP